MLLLVFTFGLLGYRLTPEMLSDFVAGINSDNVPFAVLLMVRCKTSPNLTLLSGLDQFSLTVKLDATNQLLGS